MKYLMFYDKSPISSFDVLGIVSEKSGFAIFCVVKMVSQFVLNNKMQKKDE